MFRTELGALVLQGNAIRRTTMPPEVRLVVGTWAGHSPAVHLFTFQ